MEGIKEPGCRRKIEVCLSREDALCRSKWCVGVDQIAAGLR